MHHIPLPKVHKYQARPYYNLRNKSSIAARAAAASPAGGPWNVPDLCKAYNWPANLGGGGIIAIVELNGGWVKDDIDAYFQSINQPSPQITDVSVDGTENNPNQFQTDDPDVEVALDIEVAGAAYFAATGKAANIRVYWSQDIGTAVQKATVDGCDVCSISWGADESNWGKAAAQQMEDVATAATAAGMAVFAASGDNDSGDGGATAANVDVPASCPHVVGCGGTNKTSTDETVWNDNPGQTNGQGTGGGFSTLFPVQAFQINAPAPPADPKVGKGRMVPDVSANADPATGYNIIVHGSQTVVGGTSAVAPLYAGLFASFGTKLGFVTPTLWQNQSIFNDITVGNNGLYSAGPGPDPCTGIGSPIGTKIAAFFAPAPPAQTASDAAPSRELSPH
jgi:kumamolisin